MLRDFYAVLGVSRTASSEEIRARFRDLARQRHPDRFRGEEKERAELEFQDITEAFNLLSDPDRRRYLDLELARPRAVQAEETAQLVRLYLQRGIKAYKDKNYLEAAENFNRAVKAEPGNAKAWHHLALACSHQRRWLAQAQTAIAKACELDAMNAGYLKLAGKLFALTGMNAKAERYYNEALTWGGEDPEIRSALDALKKDVRKPGRLGRSGR